MSPEPTAPPLRDLPPGRLETHHTHLLAEIGRQPRWRRGLPAIRWTSLRVTGVSATAAAAAAALAVTWAGGSGPGKPAPSSSVSFPPLAYVSHASPPRAGQIQTGHQTYVPTGATGADGPVDSVTADRTHPWVRVPMAVYVLARRQEAWNRDRHPATVQWVKTTRQLAVSAQSGDRVDSPGRPVYFVVLRGHFVDKNAYFLGSSADAPRGTLLSFTIDRKSGEILDVAIGNGKPDYSKTGRPREFSFREVRGTK